MRFSDPFARAFASPPVPAQALMELLDFPPADLAKAVTVRFDAIGLSDD